MKTWLWRGWVTRAKMDKILLRFLKIFHASYTVFQIMVINTAQRKIKIKLIFIFLCAVYSLPQSETKQNKNQTG